MINEDEGREIAITVFYFYFFFLLFMVFFYNCVWSITRATRIIFRPFYRYTSSL